MKFIRCIPLIVISLPVLALSALLTLAGLLVLAASRAGEE